MDIRNIKNRFQTYLLEKFWLMPVSVGIVTFLSEYIDHHHEGPFLRNREFLREVFIFSVLFPIILGVIFYYLKKIFQERNTLTYEFDLMLELGNNLANAETWEDVLSTVSGYLLKSIPLQRLYLSVFDPDQKVFQIVADWGNDVPDNDYLKPNVSELSETFNFLSARSLSSESNSSRFIQTDPPDDQSSRYILALYLNDVVFSFMILDISSENGLSPDQNKTISTILPEINMAVAHIYSKEFYIDQNPSMQKERQRIARLLHDTLAQDLAYLQLKLDLLCEQDSLIGILEVQRDLERMHTVAKSAYDQVRGTLDSLVPEIPQNISQAIQILAHSICDPSEIKVNFTNTGQPKPLPPETKRKILNIANEALTNVVKHSGASEVRINISWSEERVSFEFEDYGKGFTPEESIKDQHYGLIFMKERAEAINADLKICSNPNDGTKTILSLPILELNPETS